MGKHFEKSADDSALGHLVGEIEGFVHDEDDDIRRTVTCLISFFSSHFSGSLGEALMCSRLI